MGWLGLILLCGCNETCPPAHERWTEEEQLFHRDPSWRGGDAAFSVDLGAGRVLWLFGDSFISSNGSRSGAPFARNSIALQEGYDPTSANLRWFHGQAPDLSFFASPGDGKWYWPGPGARLGSRLLVFVARMQKDSSDPLGFTYDAPALVLIANPDADPPSWQMETRALPRTSWGSFIGVGGAYLESGYLYAYSARPDNHDVYLARYPVDAASFDDPEWATDAGWVAQSQLGGAPKMLFNGHTELTVHSDGQKLIEIQPLGFPEGDVAMRTASSVTGPWSEPRVLYRTPEASCQNVLTYAAKAHPELQTPDGTLALSYATNSLDLATLVHDESLYYPRFIRFDPTSGTVR